MPASRTTALFALVPALAVCLAVAGRLVSDGQVQEYLDSRLVEVFGPKAAGFSEAVASTLGSSGTIAGLGLVGAGTLVLAATLLVISLQDALNTIWELPVVSGLRHSFLRRLGAFVVILAAGGVLVLAFAINSITAVIDRLVPDVVILESMTELFGAATSWALGVGVFVLLFRYLPDSRVPWRAAIDRRGGHDAAGRARHDGDRVLPAALRREHRYRVPPAASRSSCCGCTTRRRSCWSVPSSPASIALDKQSLKGSAG